MRRIAGRLRREIHQLNKTSILLVLAGNLIQAFGIANIHAYSGVTEGGAVGMELLLLFWFRLSPAISSIVINIICYTVGRRVLGNSFLFYSAIAVGSYSVFYALCEPFAPLWPVLLQSPLLCALLGALFIGVGAGLSVLGGGATAGDDALAMSLSKRFNIGIQYVYLASDLIVLALALTYIPLNRIAYSLLTVVLSGQIIGWMMKLRKED